MQYGFVVATRIGRHVVEHGLELALIEQVLWYQPLFLDEPHENEARDQADDIGGSTLIYIGVCACWEGDVLGSPKIPVGDVAVEALVEFATAENIAPYPLQVHKTAHGMLLQNGRQCEVIQNIQMPPVWLGDVDVFDERDLFEYIAGIITLMHTAVDNGNGEGIAMLKQDEHRHGEVPVELTGDAG